MTHPTEPAPAPARSRPALSPSRAGDFKQCPLLYRFRAIDRLPEKLTTAQVRGTLVHAALESLYGLPAAGRGRETAVTLVEPAWDRMLEQSPELAEVVPADDRDRFLGDARRIVEDYYRLEDPTAFDPEACELRIETALADGVPLRGFVDRVDVAPTGEVRVVDYKTGRAPREGFERTALFQMKFYALMLLQTRGVVPTQLRLLYLTEGEVLTYTPDHDELRRFERTLSAIWRAILDAGRTGDFEPSPGRMCGFCDHRDRCPAFGGSPPPYPGWPDPGDGGVVDTAE
ncbi:RecB family exonuclease [Rhodococcus sp. NPDC058505]|uniref:RecB family exonuclease n=1 Tax=unclassified Rhodococcus (in: high G+C Gram-positive bacteria) TaxID=192944 RepID=UPI003662F015